MSSRVLQADRILLTEHLSTPLIRLAGCTEEWVMVGRTGKTLVSRALNVLSLVVSVANFARAQLSDRSENGHKRTLRLDLIGTLPTGLI